MTFAADEKDPTVLREERIKKQKELIASSQSSHNNSEKARNDSIRFKTF